MIRALPETVFQFFTDSARWASWWGTGSTIDPKPGGQVYIRHANGIESAGEVVEVIAPQRIVFTYGFVSGKPIPSGSSRVTIRLEPDEQGTRLHLTHEFAEADRAVRDEHVQGWRFQLSLFSNVVANEAYANAAATVDAWFTAWAIPDAQARTDAFAAIAAPDVSFRDRFSVLDSLEDLSTHAGAAQRFMPGITLKRNGAVRQCQGMVLADWLATDTAGQERMSGTSLVVFRPNGKISAVTGFTNPPANPETR